jgi:hypothetical protein
MSPESLLAKLKYAFNNHDIGSFSDCFKIDYHSEQPAHPDRTFDGQEQAIKNWVANFKEMPDFTAQLISHLTDKNTIWAEWDWKGTRKEDKSSLHMRGVTIFGIQEGRIQWGRLYVEPVEMNGQGIETAVKQVMHGSSR